ncbi:hypothetical protein A0H81_03195 [Grifola frondosa]|uniref:Uncharacterized protein n=1 Tax=Grifola frondosa TaxID=5627 RepID=A0A1C7MJC7_GRIFR|nr:hypothetical protein A0H81_03195 [Grifola frondosa]
MLFLAASGMLSIEDKGDTSDTPVSRGMLFGVCRVDSRGWKWFIGPSGNMMLTGDLPGSPEIPRAVFSVVYAHAHYAHFNKLLRMELYNAVVPHCTRLCYYLIYPSLWSAQRRHPTEASWVVTHALVSASIGIPGKEVYRAA